MKTAFFLGYFFIFFWFWEYTDYDISSEWILILIYKVEYISMNFYSCDWINYLKILDIWRCERWKMWLSNCNFSFLIFSKLIVIDNWICAVFKCLAKKLVLSWAYDISELCSDFLLFKFSPAVLSTNIFIS